MESIAHACDATPQLLRAVNQGLDADEEGRLAALHGETDRVNINRVRTHDFLTPHLNPLCLVCHLPK